MTQIWFTSDTHFWHEKIIEYSNRPFTDLDEMHEQLIHRWNTCVSKSDLVYHLGDFGLTWDKQKDRLKVEQMLSRLNGCKQLICGNHDRDAVKKAVGWSWVGDYKRINPDGQKIVLFHYPIRSWHGIGKGAWHLFGHSHGNLCPDGLGKSMDVGVDCHAFAPLSYDEIREYMNQQEPVYMDHHAGELET